MIYHYAGTSKIMYFCQEHTEIVDSGMEQPVTSLVFKAQ